VDVAEFAALCRRLLAESEQPFRPLVCVPASKQLAFFMDESARPSSATLHRWATTVAGNAREFLLAFPLPDSRIQIDAVSDGVATSTFLDAISRGD
jgi:hypothetical protein